MKNRIFIIIFVFILLFGTSIRFFDLGDVPSSLDWDEVSQGYNAYAILQTGKDEFGTPYPITIRSLNDYKTPVFTYISIIPIKFFGLTPFAARFPSALFGSLSVFLVGAFIYKLLKTKMYGKQIALLSMFFFAISPWSIQFSRTAFDANVALFFVLLGSWCFVMGIQKKVTWLLFISICMFGISCYTTHSEKIFSPLFLIALFIWGKNYLLKIKMTTVFLFLLFVGLNLFWILDTTATSRSRGVLFTASSDSFLNTAITEQVFDQKNNDKIDVLLHNRRLVYLSKYLENYLSHFNLNTLFISGDNARHHAPNVGVLYLFSLPIILLGMIFVVRNKIANAYLLFAWILLAPVTSGFAIDAPNYQRSLIFLPSWQVFEACGWYYIFFFLRRVRFSFIFKFILIFFMSVNIFYYFYQYWVHTNSEYGKYWQYGYKEAILATQQYKNTSKKVFFASDIEQAYIFYLFYTKYDPKKYLSTGSSSRLVNSCYTIDNAYFGVCSDKIKRGDLYITSKQAPSGNYTLINEINYTSTKDPAINIYEHL